ncbi:MAG: type IV secretion system DNA-binding domain-containing protein [Gemmatales bacterium]
MPILLVRTPTGQKRSPLYMEQILSSLHQAGHWQTPLELRLDSSKNETRLQAKMPETLRPLFQSQVFAAYPDCQITEDDALDQPRDLAVLTAEARLAGDLFAIKRYPEFEDTLNRTTADPLASLLLTLNELCKWGLQPCFRILIRPASHAILDRFERIYHRSITVFSAFTPWWFARAVQWACSNNYVERLFSRLLAAAFPHSSQDHASPTSKLLHNRDDAWLTAREKLQRQLYETRLFLEVTAPKDKHAQAKQALEALGGTLGLFQRFPFAKFFLGPVRRRRRGRKWLSKRGFLLSAAEIATLWHPPSQTVQAPAFQGVEWREMEPPLHLPSAREPDAAQLGRACFRGMQKSVAIRPSDRLRHVALLGKTGMGKTTLLRHLLESDLKMGKGLCLIDPHGDLVEEVLHAIPTHRTNDIVLFDAADSLHPVAFNMLDCPRPEQRPLVVSGILTAFKKIFGEFWGPRLEYVFRNSLLALIDCPNTTLLSAQRFLIDSVYRKSVLSHCTDATVRDFWEMEFTRIPPKLQAETISPIQNKIGQFTLSPQLRNIIGQPANALKMREIMDQGRVLLVNVSKGRLGEDASSLLGALLITHIQMAALSRSDITEDARRDFYLYVDEFQNFATDSFATILSEARKYKLGLTVANQYLAQLNEATLHALFGNVGSMVCFECGAKDAELLAEQLGGDTTPQDLMRLPKYHAYTRLLIDGHPSRPFSMTTLAPRKGLQEDRADIVRRVSQRRYTHAARS